MKPGPGCRDDGLYLHASPLCLAVWWLEYTGAGLRIKDRARDRLQTSMKCRTRLGGSFLEDAMSGQNTRLVRRALNEVFAGGNLAVVNEIFHPDFVNHEAGPRTPPGPEGLKVTVRWLRDAFSDLHYTIEDEIVS